ncbi:hypothetical protein [Acidicapsa acidisoli]|uniref:hypothetical protein n=1 Tax=Acidicapsa acidisoli TaxID=1615681 RepID=UPI0021DF90F9|nr:hypothetical protein [Acidicapsa acidisoli]
MSYLNPLRLNFAGRFKAAPSTVNNDPTHFNNATFKPQYQEWGKGANNGWWNPSGDAVFRLIDCAVTTAFLGGDEVSGDRVLSFRVTDTATRMPAKMVDLDSEQQMVSQIWGLQVRICDAEGNDALSGEMDVTSFIDIWQRDIGSDVSKVGDGFFSTYYQSVLTNVKWSETLTSPFLQQLRAQSTDRSLSIHFIVDGYNMDHTSPDFTYGRIVGSIGPHAANEPKRFTLGRYLAPTGAQGYSVNYCTAVVDEATSKLLVDLGNALPTDGCGGPQSNLGTLTVACQSPGGWQPLCSINYLDTGWYTRYAGISAIPFSRPLNKAELAAIQSGPLAIQFTPPGGGPTVTVLQEAANGQHVRADQFVFRADPGDVVKADLWMTQWGEPMVSGSITVVLDNSQLQGQPGVWPDVGTPAEAISFQKTLQTNPEGRASLEIETTAPGNPRDYIDGQVYGIRAYPASQKYSDQDQQEFISMLLWDDFTPDEPITWYGSMEPIFQQYANLYPVMARFLNLASYDDICANRNVQLLRMAFGLEESDPNVMPVTRDLSGAKRKAILRWLTEVGPDGKPLLGVRKVDALPVSDTAQPQSSSLEVPSSLLMKGGKAVAMSRRLGQPRSDAQEAK